MSSIRTPPGFKAKLNYLLFERFDASEREMRKFHFGTQMGFLGGMCFCVLESVIGNIPVLRHFGLTGIIYAFILLLIFFFIKKVQYLILTKELGLLAIVFYFTYHTGGLLTCGGIILVGIVPVLVSLSFKNYRQIIPVFSTYFLSVIYLALADKSLPGKDLIPSDWNLILFAATLLACTFVFFIFALLAQRIYTNLEHREAKRQKEISDAKTRLYTNITHEFRTPLTVILGLADSAKSNGQQNIPAKMDTIIKNGKNLLQLVDQMLDLSKLESGRMSVNKISANIIPFLKYVFQLQEFYAEAKNISMRFSSESQSYEIEFDPEKLASIVSNLLSNAIKFTPDDGQINMKVYRSDEHMCIEIVDNGIGIPPEKQQTIFDRFYQVDDESTRKQGGAGIGLAITRELVELLEGTIELRSHPDIGTAFTVKLPYTPAPEIAVAQINTDCEIDVDADIDTDRLLQNASPDHQRLLIVEDNPDVVGYLRACYQNHFSILAAKEGKEGFQRAVEEIPDIIISDVMMPEMDGFELCRKLKDDYRTSHIPIILLTAKADIPSRIEGLETGADAYIVKPFNQRELLVRMQKLLELRRKLFRRYSTEKTRELSTDPILQKEDQFIQKIDETIRNNLGDEFFNIQVLCSEMAMSKSQLYRKFKALTNQSAAKHIRTMRMEKAKDLLQSTSMNITEGGYEVGMKSVSAFSQVFKEEYGQSPSDFVHRMADNH